MNLSIFWSFEKLFSVFCCSHPDSRCWHQCWNKWIVPKIIEVDEVKHWIYCSFLFVKSASNHSHVFFIVFHPQFGSYQLWPHLRSPGLTNTSFCSLEWESYIYCPFSIYFSQHSCLLSHCWPYFIRKWPNTHLILWPHLFTALTLTPVLNSHPGAPVCSCLLRSGLEGLISTYCCSTH